MNVKSVGNGSLRILLVPGGPGLVVGAYRELVELLAEKSEVFTYEQRGNYYRDMDDFPHTEKEYAEELLEVYRSLPDDERPLVLFGHSFGGAISIEALAAGLPAAGVVLSNSYSDGSMLSQSISDRIERLPEEGRKRLASIPDGDSEAMDSFVAEVWFPNCFCRLNPWPESLLDALGRLNPKLMAHFLGSSIVETDGAAARWHGEPLLGKIEQPVLVVSGKYDYYAEDTVMRMASLFPNASAWISETSSHTPWLEDPERFKSRVDSFLDRFR